MLYLPYLYLVGCYNGSIYTFKTVNGKIHWCLSTSDYCDKKKGDKLHEDIQPVKCSPALDSNTGQLWVGGHNGYIYALDVQVRKLTFFFYLLPNFS